MGNRSAIANRPHMSSTLMPCSKVSIEQRCNCNKRQHTGRLATPSICWATHLQQTSWYSGTVLNVETMEHVHTCSTEDNYMFCAEKSSLSLLAVSQAMAHKVLYNCALCYIFPLAGAPVCVSIAWLSTSIAHYFAHLLSFAGCCRLAEIS